MGTEIIPSFGNLQNELEEARSSLKNVEENLKRLIGRDPSDLPPRNNLKRPFNDDKSKQSFNNKNVNNKTRNITYENEEPQPKKRNNISVFKRLSNKVEDPPEFPQRAIISKIIVTNKEIPSREEAIVAQNSDVKFRERNRRMFGALLGTLQKFQQEETKLKPMEEKRAKLEKKIEEHEKQEKLEIRKERQELFVNRKKKQAEIKLIELKMMRAKEYTNWEESHKPRMNFIKTKAKPPIYYVPRRTNAKTKELLETSKADITKLMEKKKNLIVSELQAVEERMKRNFDYKYGLRSQQQQEQNQQTIIASEQQNSDNSDHDDEDVLTEAQIAIAKTNVEAEKCQEAEEMQKSIIKEEKQGGLKLEEKQLHQQPQAEDMNDDEMEQSNNSVKDEENTETKTTTNANDKKSAELLSERLYNVAPVEEEDQQSNNHSIDDEERDNVHDLAATCSSSVDQQVHDNDDTVNHDDRVVTDNERHDE